MSIELLHQLSGLYLLLIVILIAWLAIIFVAHFFVPKALLRAYFKEPYFSPTEIAFFTGFPFAYMRTAMFMRLAGWPNSGKRRGITGVSELVPAWFRCVSKFLVYTLLSLFSLLIVMSVIMYLGLCVFHDHC